MTTKTKLRLKVAAWFAISFLPIVSLFAVLFGIIYGILTQYNIDDTYLIMVRTFLVVDMCMPLLMFLGGIPSVRIPETECEQLIETAKKWLEVNSFGLIKVT